MAEFVKLNPVELKKLREVNPMMMSYNIEFAEVTGGTFWKAYAPGQIAGTKPFNVDMSGGVEQLVGETCSTDELMGDDPCPPARWNWPP